MEPLTRVTAIDVMRAVAEAVAAGADDLTAVIVGRTYREVAGYRGVPPEDLEAATRNTLGFLMGEMRAGRIPNGGAELEFDRPVVRRRIGQGVRATDWNQHGGIFVEELQAAILDASRRRGLPETAITELIVELWGAAQRAQVANNARFDAVARELAQGDEDRRGAFVLGVLHGTLPAGEIRAGAAAFELDPEALYLPVRARGPGDLLASLRRAEPTVGPRSLWVGFEGDVCGVATARPIAVPGATFGLGPAVLLEACADAFADATAALRTAVAFERTGAHTLADLGALPAVMTGGRAAEALLARLVGRVEPHLVDTVAAYLDARQHVTETAAALHLHPNGLRKRLRRYEQITGTDLRSMDDLAAIWWALRRRELAARARR